MEKKKLKLWLNFMEVKQQCPMMMRHILPILFLTGRPYKRVAGIQKSIEARNSITNGKKENYGSATYVGSQGAHGVYWSLHRIFPETFQLLNIILVLPVGTASVKIF